MFGGEEPPVDIPLHSFPRIGDKTTVITLASDGEDPIGLKIEEEFKLEEELKLEEEFESLSVEKLEVEGPEQTGFALSLSSFLQNPHTGHRRQELFRPPGRSKGR
jgi:hypothetical protein